jgi:hypothetical protein
MLTRCHIFPNDRGQWNGAGPLYTDNCGQKMRPISPNSPCRFELPLDRSEPRLLVVHLDPRHTDPLGRRLRLFVDGHESRLRIAALTPPLAVGLIPQRQAKQKLSSKTKLTLLLSVKRPRAMPSRPSEAAGQLLLALCDAVQRRVLSLDKEASGIVTSTQVIGVRGLTVLPAKGMFSRYGTSFRRKWLSRLLMRSLPWHIEDFPYSHFDGTRYLNTYPDAAEAVLAGIYPSAVAHYRSHGRRNGYACHLTMFRAPSSGTATQFVKWQRDANTALKTELATIRSNLSFFAERLDQALTHTKRGTPL